ncbi:sulfite exporter TauE/SafE family protein [Salinarimonas soli]|uniref:Probable membrane transporter protein n=1 Tax=Salinarimonas soli TaxID=1638099 RepID=A0A5B2VAA7_9HYPH|nr:sulfite exporter TauE/SafE family protein [Salinarimonas soli]KAA2235736.1 sulfite exporter TauE/SafE family protein [Salinarimonas soli]
MAFALADLTLAQIALVAATAFGASIIGGLAGYGTGLLLPLVLAPIIGPENVVPVISVTALFTNVSRFLALRTYVAWGAVARIVPAALLPTALGATLFAGLDARGAALVIGSALIALVPLRRILQKRGFTLTAGQLVPAGAAYGFVTGGTSGAGVILVSFLMAAGLAGPAVVATDAAISILIGTVKAATFGFNQALPAPLLIFALLVGCATVPGAFVAKALLHRLPVRIHTAMLEIAILAGGAVLVWRGLAG